MTLHVSLTHRTAYTYDRRIGMGPQTVRLRPAPHCRTPILAYSLTITPETHWLNWLQDPFGNFQARIILPEPTREFSVTVDLVADMAVINPFEFFVEEEVKAWPFKYDPTLAAELKPNMEPLPATPRLDRYIRDLGLKSTVTIDFLCDLNRKLSQDIGYLIRMEPGVQSPEETLTLGSGSCRDSGWLLVQILRRLGLAARFVSGYLIQLKPDEKPLDGPAGATKDFTDLHAWAEVYVPGAGWIGLDPTSGLLAGEGHIPLAATPNPSSAAPISGGHEKAEVAFSFDMRVDRIVETPRVTKPYRDEQWQAILDAGATVDEKLRDGDVRLSMGGEPTFVSIDDVEGAEWNTAAVGPTKRHFAEDLMRRLQARFAPGGLLHYGQGKWYPGEQLPRWSFAVYWRADTEPLWENPDHIARENPARPATIESADRFARHLCKQLGLAPDSAIPAYEDPAHFLLVEQRLPLNLEPGDKRLADPGERARLVQALDAGLDTARAYVLPVQVWQTKDRGRRWVTERWALRRQRLYLQPGDSPVGFRLPLGALPFLSDIDFPHVWPADPLAQQTPLPPRQALLQQRRTVTLEALKPPLPVATEIAGAVRTALSIEPRDGQLCVFMPPLEDAEDYAAMVGAIEAAAAETEQPIHIEGYPPPFDSRLNVIKVTPDPGVIEVNIQPATSWAQSVEITTSLYEEARLARLGTEKFMLDGRHTGTQGGNHIVLGGITPADSPFLRRPGFAGEPGHLLAEPSLALVSVLRLVHRPDQSGAAHRRGPPRQPLRAGDRPGPGAASGGRADPAVAGRSPVPQSPHRRDRQYTSGGNLHRQAVFARRSHGPSRSRRVPLVRDAAARPDELGAAALAAGPDRLVLGAPLPRPPHSMGHLPARPLHAWAFCLDRFPRRHPRSRWGGIAGVRGLVHPAPRFPLSTLRHCRSSRTFTGYPASTRTVECARRGRSTGRHRALCRFVGGTARGPHGRPGR